jgi:hypothetical protein
MLSFVTQLKRIDVSPDIVFALSADAAQNRDTYDEMELKTHVETRIFVMLDERAKEFSEHISKSGAPNGFGSIRIRSDSNIAEVIIGLSGDQIEGLQRAIHAFGNDRGDIGIAVHPNTYFETIDGGRASLLEFRARVSVSIAGTEQ